MLYTPYAYTPYAIRRRRRQMISNILSGLSVTLAAAALLAIVLTVVWRIDAVQCEGLPKMMDRCAV